MLNSTVIRRFFVTVDVLSYLAVLADSYPTKRRLWYDVDNGPRECAISASVPQSSVLRPLF